MKPNRQAYFTSLDRWKRTLNQKTKTEGIVFGGVGIVLGGVRIVLGGAGIVLGGVRIVLGGAGIVLGGEGIVFLTERTLVA